MVFFRKRLKLGKASKRRNCQRGGISLLPTHSLNIYGEYRHTYGQIAKKEIEESTLLLLLLLLLFSQ